MTTLTTLSNLSDAFVLRSMLESSEIPAFLPDENTVQIDWGLTNAIGGIRVQVPAELMEKARLVLQQFQENLKDAPSFTSLSGEPIAEPAAIAEPSSNPSDDPRQTGGTSWIAVTLVGLVLAMVAGFGFLVERGKERKAASDEAIGNYNDGDYGHAIANFSRAIELGAKSKEVYFNRGIAFLAQGEKTQNKQDYNAAITDFNTAIQIDSTYGDAYTNLATTYEHEAEYDKAISNLNQSIAINPENGSAYFSRGYAHQAKREFAEAIADYDKSISFDPTNELAFASRGFSHDEMGDYNLAIADDSEALKLNPTDEIAIANRGKAYVDKGDNDHAIADFDAALRIDPDDRQTLFNRASVYTDKGEYAKAIADYNQAISVEPNQPDAYLNLARLLATCPNASFRDGKRAVELATKGIQLSKPNYPFAVEPIALAYAEVGDFPNAIKWEQKYLDSIRDKPDDLAASKELLSLFQHNKPYHEKK